MRHVCILLLFFLLVACADHYARLSPDEVKIIKPFPGYYPETAGIYEVSAKDLLQANPSGKQRLVVYVIPGAIYHPIMVEQCVNFAKAHREKFELYMVTSNCRLSKLQYWSNELQTPLFVLDHILAKDFTEKKRIFFTQLSGQNTGKLLRNKEIPLCWLICEEGNLVDATDDPEQLSKYFQ